MKNKELFKLIIIFFKKVYNNDIYLYNINHKYIKYIFFHNNIIHPKTNKLNNVILYNTNINKIQGCSFTYLYDINKKRYDYFNLESEDIDYKFRQWLIVYNRRNKLKSIK